MGIKRNTRNTKKENPYVAVGAILMIPQEESYKFGYAETLAHPVLVYSNDGKPSLDNEKLFHKSDEFTIDDNYLFIPNHLIKEKYTMEEAQELFPELFL